MNTQKRRAKSKTLNSDSGRLGYKKVKPPVKIPEVFRKYNLLFLKFT